MSDKNSVLDEEDFMDLPDGLMPPSGDFEIDDDDVWPPAQYRADGNDVEIKEEDEDEEDAPNYDVEGEGGEEADETIDADSEAVEAARAAHLEEVAQLRAQLEEANKGRAKNYEDLLGSVELSLHAVDANAGALEYRKDGIEQAIRSLTSQLRSAKEDGEVEKEMKIQEELDARRKDFDKVERDLSQIPNFRKTFEDRRNALQAEQNKFKADEQARIKSIEESQPRAGTNVALGEPTNPKAKAWASQNAWIKDPKHRVKAAALGEIDRALSAEGYSPTTDAYYREMTKRMHAEFPTLQVKYADGKAPATGARTRGAKTKGAPVAPANMSRGLSKKSADKGKVQIGKADIAMLRAMRLNPEDPKVLRELAGNKANKTPYMR